MSRHRRRDCPLCGGHQTVSVSRGTKVEWLAQCFRCHSSFKLLAPALGLPLEKKERRPRAPIRAQSPFELAVGELLRELELRQAKYLSIVEWFEMNAQVRHEMNMTRFLHQIATDFGCTSEMGWDFALEAAQRETRARLLLIELDRQLSELNQTRQQFLAGVEVTT